MSLSIGQTYSERLHARIAADDEQFNSTPLLRMPTDGSVNFDQAWRWMQEHKTAVYITAAALLFLAWSRSR